MKIVQINATCGIGSTGKICVDISRLLAEKNIQNYILYCSGASKYPLGIKCTSDQYIKMQAALSKIRGTYGFNSKQSTYKMISELNRIQPDIIHLHNIHGHDCNLDILFNYFKKNKQKLIWTFHDCWAFTAYCPCFDLIKCDQWKTNCFDCRQKSLYSWFFDKSSKLYKKKKTVFAGLDLTIATPSQWLADLVKQSFLKDYPIKVINNGIDLDVYKPTEGNFRERYAIASDKHIVLGVALGWGARKGLDVFTALSERLDKSYQIILVGTDDKADRQLPENIISIHRTHDQKELAEIYTAADVFVNPTREDNFPTVNIESIACGTPVITFRTGGSPEMLDNTCGSVVDCDNIDAMEQEIIRVCMDKPYTKEDCLRRAKDFDKHSKFHEYIELYEAIGANHD